MTEDEVFVAGTDAETAQRLLVLAQAQGFPPEVVRATTTGGFIVPAALDLEPGPA